MSNKHRYGLLSNHRSEREEDERATASGFGYAQRDAGGPPPGWQAGAAEVRLVKAATASPATYDARAHTVEAVLATAYRVRRWFGWEELAMREDAIDLRRVALGQCRLLDSHDQSTSAAALGTILAARVERGQLVGTIKFHDSERGREAERQVAAGELTGISVGYRINKLVRFDDPASDDDCYRAEAWELLEASLVSVPADPHAAARSLSTGLRPRGTLSYAEAAILRRSLAQRLAERPSSAVAIAEEILRTQQNWSAK